MAAGETNILKRLDFDSSRSLYISLFVFHFSPMDTEDEYLAAAEKMVNKLRKAKPHHIREFLFGEVSDLGALPATLDKILANIAQVREIPEEKRTYEF
jgi:hypothetical protein